MFNSIKAIVAGRVIHLIKVEIGVKKRDVGKEE